MSKCVDCDHYEPTVGELCSYCYKKSLVVLSDDDQIAEVCRKCDRGYKYTEEEAESDTGDVGYDICRDCVRRRRLLWDIPFTKDQLRDLLRLFK